MLADCVSDKIVHENFYREFLTYSRKGVDFYVTYENGEYGIYSLQGTLLAADLTEIKLIDVEGGVKVVYENEDEIKALTSKNSSVRSNLTIAAVYNNNIPKYDPYYGVTYASDAPAVKVNDSNGTLQIAGDASPLFNNSNFSVSEHNLVEESVSGVYAYTLTLNKSGKHEYDRYIRNHLDDIINASNGKIDLENLRFRISYTKNGDEVFNLGIRLAFSAQKNGNWITPEVTVTLQSNTDGYYFGLYDLTKMNLNFEHLTFDETRLGSDVDDIYNDKFPASTISYTFTYDHRIGLEATSGTLAQVEFWLSSLQITVSPILYAQGTFARGEDNQIVYNGTDADGQFGSNDGSGIAALFESKTDSSDSRRRNIYSNLGNYISVNGEGYTTSYKEKAGNKSSWSTNKI